MYPKYGLALKRSLYKYLGPKIILFEYMDPWGNDYAGRSTEESYGGEALRNLGFGIRGFRASKCL